MAPTRMATESDRLEMRDSGVEYILDLSKYDTNTLVELTQEGTITVFELDEELSQRHMTDLEKLHIIREATGAA